MKGGTERRGERGIALLMVILTLSALLLIGVPFYLSMVGFCKTGTASRRDEVTETGAYGSVKWAVDALAQSDAVRNGEAVTDYGGTGILNQDDLPGALKNGAPLLSGVKVEDESGRIDVNSLTITLVKHLLGKDSATQAAYKIMLWPIRPVGDEDWTAAPQAPRQCYRPFRTPAQVREIANVVDIDKDPPVPPGAGYLSRDEYLGIRDCLRVDYERLKTDRWFKAALLLKNAAQNDTQIQVVFSPHLNAGTLVRIRDADTGSYEYNFCTGVSCSADDAAAGRMKVSLLFGLRQSYTGRTTCIEVPERVPVNVNTASYKVLKAVLWGIMGKLEGTVYTVTEEEAERIAADIVARRRSVPFSADRFMEYDIADLIDDLSNPETAAMKAALIRLHALNPYDARLVASTVGFRFSSERTFRITGLSCYVNPHSRLETGRGTVEYVVNVYPCREGGESAWGSSTQYAFLRDLMLRGRGLITGPNPLAALDMGVVSLADFGTKDGIRDFEENETGAVPYVAPAPLQAWWNRGWNERTTLIVHLWPSTRGAVLNGDPGLGFYTVGSQKNTGTAGVFGVSSADAWKNDLVPEGVALGTDTTEKDYLEYELRGGGGDKVKRDPAWNNVVYEGFSFECWMKPGEGWDALHRYYLFDIARTAAEEPDPVAREYQNRVSFFYDGTTSELVLRVADTSIKQEFAEWRQKAAFDAGKWYHLKAVIRGGGSPGYDVSTAYKLAVFVDGKPCWKLDPADGDDKVCRGGLRPGAELDQALGVADVVIQVDDGSDFPAGGGVVQVGRERIEYAHRAGNTLTGCIRGCRGTTAVSHPAGTRVVLFGYSCNLVDIPLMKGGGTLVDTLKNDPDMPSVIVTPTDNPPDGKADFVFQEGDASITLPAPYNIADFPDRGFLEIESGASRAVVYYVKAGNTLSFLDWDEIQTAEEQGGDLQFPPTDTVPGAEDITFTVISIRVSDTTNYPDADACDGLRGYIQIDDEWFQYGRDECTAGKYVYNGEHYFIGTTNLRRSAGMGGPPAAHAAPAKVIPVFRVDDANAAPMVSNGIDLGEKVSIVDVNNADMSVEDSKEEMTINYSGSEGGRHWLAFTDNVAHRYNVEAGTRILKFPSGEMPALLSGTIVVGNSRSCADPLEGEIDEVAFHRSGYGTAVVLDIDGSGEITEADAVTAASPRYIEITRTPTAANQQGGADFRPAGLLRMNGEVFAYVFDSAPAGRYKLRLIGRELFKTRPALHRVYDTVFILEGIPCTVVPAGETLTPETPLITVVSTAGFPPRGFLRIDDEIIGYTYKDVSLLGKPYFGMEASPGLQKKGVWRGRFGTQPASHGEYTLVRLFYARYPDYTPLTFDAGGNVTKRWDPSCGVYVRKVFCRENTVFGLPDSDSSADKNADLSVGVSVRDAGGARNPLPPCLRVRILAASGRNPDWTKDPPSPADFTDDIQEFIVNPGEGGVTPKTFDFKARKAERLELRVFFEYLPGVWSPASDPAIRDPSGVGCLNWKLRPGLDSLTLRLRGKNVIYEVHK